MKDKWHWVVTVLALATIGVAACGPLGGPAEKTVYVGPYEVDCVGVAPQKCLLIKENPQAEWRMYYDQIEGFAFEPGYEWELRVLEERVEQPPADASSIRWTLVEVVSQTRSLEGTTWVMDSYLNSEGVLVDALPDSEATVLFQAGEIGGKASCNNYFGTYILHGDGKLTVTVGGMTEMYCAPEELMAQEQAFVAALNKAARYIIADDKLQIEDVSGEQILVFSALLPEPLTGTPWQLTGYNDGKGGFVSVLTGTEITALFGEDGKLGGSGGCNNYATSYELSGDRITIGPVAATMMMCPGPEGIMDQEGAYLAALESAATYQVEGAHLSLFDAGGEVLLTYTVLEPTPLAGTPWQLLGYNNGKGGVVSVIIGTEITALFSEDGRMTGSAGCNNYTTSYEADPATGAASGAISIGPAATTRMYCAEPQGTMEQESLYLASLEKATTYRIDGDRLELRDAGGALMANYTVPAQEAAGAGGAGLDEDTLANIEYKSEYTRSGMAPLSAGEYREQAAPGSATEIVVRLTEYVAYGELNGQPAAAVVLVTDPGGSGTFYDLAVVLEQDGQPVNVASTLLGDRVQIQSLSIAENQILVDMITHGPEDPMCCPTQRVVQTYALEGDQLVLTSSQVIGSEGGSSDLTGVAWKWEKFEGSDDTTVVVDDPDKYILEFLPDGQVAIQADCNAGGGVYTVEGSQLTIKIQRLTRAMCPPESLSQQYIRYLGEVVSYLREGDRLALALRYDSGILTFIP